MLEPVEPVLDPLLGVLLLPVEEPLVPSPDELPVPLRWESLSVSVSVPCCEPVPVPVPPGVYRLPPVAAPELSP